MILIKDRKKFKKFSIDSWYKKKKQGKFLKNILFLFVIFFLLLISGISLIDIIFLLFFTSSFLFRLDSRISIALGLVSLAACPLLLKFNISLAAEKMAVYAFYFLAIGIFMQATEYLRETRAKSGKIAGHYCNEKDSSQFGILSKKKNFIFLFAIALGSVLILMGVAFIYQNEDYEERLMRSSLDGYNKEDSNNSGVLANVNGIVPKGNGSIISLKILNGDNVVGTAFVAMSGIKKTIEDNLGVSNIQNNEEYDFVGTIIMHKPGKVEEAKSIKEFFANKELIALQENLDQEVDIVVAARKEKLQKEEIKEKDSDLDGLSDEEEMKYKTNPYDSDTDGDGYKDGDEIKGGYDPRGTGTLESREIKIILLNGNGIVGIANTVKDDLIISDFKAENINIRDAEDYNNQTTTISYKANFEVEAGKIAVLLENDYTVELKEVISEQEEDIIVTLGAK